MAHRQGGILDVYSKKWYRSHAETTLEFIDSVLYVGAWRSLEAHLNGVQGVGGSNPLAPTS
jgi:hypothetical protein